MEKPKKYEDRLMEALAYDEDDLAANQLGHFSQGQLARLRSERNRSVVAALLFALLLVVWLAVMPLVTGAVVTEAVVATLKPALAIFTPVITLLVISFLVRALRLRAVWREDRVLSAEGRIKLSLEYFINVGDVRLPLKEQAFLAFKNGDPYRIYYSKRLKKLLSVEWLRENDDNLLEAPPESGSAADSEFAQADSAASDLKRRH